MAVRRPSRRRTQGAPVVNYRGDRGRPHAQRLRAARGTTVLMAASTSPRVAVVGAGVIGGGWVARLVESGLDVVVHDPHPEAPRRVSEMLENAERAWAR